MAATELYGQQQINALRNRMDTNGKEIQDIIQLAAETTTEDDSDDDDDDEDHHHEEGEDHKDNINNNDNGATDEKENDQSADIAAATAATKPCGGKGKKKKKKKTTRATRAAAAKTTNNDINNILRVEVVDYPKSNLIGQVFELQPTHKKPCLLGRSRGKKFRDNNGVSLPEDYEASTNHGKFIVSQGNNQTYYFVDTESTNGTMVYENNNNNSTTTNVVALDADCPYELYTGCVLLVGTTKLKITVPTTNENDNNQETGEI